MDRVRLQKIIPVLAQKHNFRLEIVEKDYYLTLILNNIESHLSDKLIFKGGTLLNKIHLNYHRLSEDLDFTYLSKEELLSRSKRSRAIAPIRENMRKFLKFLELKSENPEGRGFNNSTQYIFDISYPSFITGKDEHIKIEVALRQIPIDKPVYNAINHFYKDPFTGESLIPTNKILSLSFNEAVAEKLKAAITRRDLAIRDYYDLWYIAEAKFDFHNKQFLSIFKKKLENERYKGDYKYNFGLSKDSIDLLYKQVETDLIPVIRVGESFDLDKVFERFNKLLKDIS
jgi:predicted nucleotidyltransferase component of viral defense system